MKIIKAIKCSFYFLFMEVVRNKMYICTLIKRESRFVVADFEKFFLFSNISAFVALFIGRLC